MHNGVEAAAQNVGEECGIPDIAFDDGETSRSGPVALDETVEDYYLVAGLTEKPRSVASDVAGATCHEDLHLWSSTTLRK